MLKTVAEGAKKTEEYQRFDGGAATSTTFELASLSVFGDWLQGSDLLGSLPYFHTIRITIISRSREI